MRVNILLKDYKIDEVKKNTAEVTIFEGIKFIRGESKPSAEETFLECKSQQKSMCAKMDVRIFATFSNIGVYLASV